ncbi:CHAT domain-containing protein [Streptomyces sp. NPDC020192]|uniref:CHAT domain-containing protein n=1 Tax=Streptomyces sp. NPDC020192 TaxID=3365066 RepID=UPI0037981BBE
MTGTSLREGPGEPPADGPAWPELSPPERDLLDRLLLFAHAGGAARRSEVLRHERTKAARTALMAKCSNGRWGNVLMAHQLGLLAWLLGTDTGDRAELGVAADWLAVVHQADPALLPEPLRSARHERFTPEGLAGLTDAADDRERALAAAQEFIAGGLGWAAKPEEAEAISAYVRGRDLSLRDETTTEAHGAALRAVAALPARHWLRPYALELAANTTTLLALARGALYAEEAEHFARQAVESAHPHHPQRARCLSVLHAYRVSALSSLLIDADMTRPDALLPPAACRETVELGREVLALLADDNPRVGDTLSFQTSALFLLLCGDPYDRALRTELLRHGRLAAERVGGTPRKEATRWLELGDYLKLLFLWTADQEVLRQLIDATAAADRVAPAGSVVAARAACALGWAEFRRAAARGDLRGLNVAADHFLRVTGELGQPAADDTPEDAAERELFRLSAHNDLQTVLLTRSELTGGDHTSRQEALTRQPEPDPGVLTGSGDIFDLVNRRQLAAARLHQAQQQFTAQWVQATYDNRPKVLRRAAAHLRRAADEFAAAVPGQRYMADGSHEMAALAVRQADAMESGEIGTAAGMVADLLAEDSPDLLLDDSVFGREDGGRRVVTSSSDGVQDQRQRWDKALVQHHLHGHQVVRMRLTVARQEAHRAVAEFERGASYADAWSRALAFCERACADPAASPADLLPVTRFIAETAVRLDDVPAVAPLLAAAVKAAGTLASPRFPRGEREELLARYVNGLGDLACAAALLADEPADRAVAVLEAARGLLSATTLSSMTELGTLYRAHPEAAARFESATEALADAQEIPPSAGLEGGSQRHRATDRWESEVRGIRKLPGFADFLEPLAPATIRALAERGPLVHVTVHGVRSHALLVTPEGAESLALPGVSPSLAQEWIARLEQAGADTAAGAADVREVLGELWDAVASPVLHALGVSGPPESPAARRRVWWVPSGSAVFLPLHAAGRFGGTPGTWQQVPGDNVLDRVVSSYTPTLRALRHARLRPAPSDRPSVLAIAAPGTAGSPDSLRWAVDEARDVRDIVRAGRYLPPQDATLATVVQALPEHPWLHYAGHGTTGALVLGNGLLTPSAVDRLSLPAAELVYLSGCETARGAAQLADESLHLASALHLAGYRDAVGTLWSVRDSKAAQITEDFYKGLLAAPGHDPAAALDAAVREARRREPARPDVWAAHLHIGP